MKSLHAATDKKVEKLRARLEKLDAERTAITAELHRLTDPTSSLSSATAPQPDPIVGAGHKDWHVFAGPANQKASKPNPVN